MADRVPFRSDGKYMYCDADKMDFLIPNSFFTKSPKYAEDQGETIRVFGIFPVEFWFGNKSTIKTMNNPFYIIIKKSNTSIEKRILPGVGETECYVMSYVSGQQIMDSQIVIDSDDAVTFLKNFITAGKIPKTIPYSQAPVVWNKNQEVSGVNFGIRSEVEELILALMYRNKENMGEKFAVKYGSDLSTDEYSYAEASIRQVCQYASTFTSLTFEDMDSMITTSLNRNRNKGKETFTPVEDILKL
ncbi:MAG TPA: hypothetical protein DCW90_22330 [Lachnospiraceae bacterium]|nr:hypothetical protein [Lachnospiraceae bacterium]